LTHEEALKNKIPKGFIDEVISITGEKVYFTNPVMSRSIYDKRMMLITKYILEAEYRYWSVKDTNHIQKIIDGGYDGV
jgi:hypothetical protein